MRQNVCSNGCQRYIRPLVTGTGHPGNTWIGQGKSSQIPASLDEAIRGSHRWHLMCQESPFSLERSPFITAMRGEVQGYNRQG
jgi:hypothetical protein